MFLQTRGEWDTPTLLDQLLTSPVKLLLRLVSYFFLFFRSIPRIGDPPISIVCISDTHTQQKDIPPGDLLIHAGDLTNAGTVEELQAAIDWLASLPHKHKIAIAGNHDTYLDPLSRKTLSAKDQAGKLDWAGIHYLQHSSITLTFPNRAGRKLVIYGAPQIPACGGPEFAFQYVRGKDAWSDTVPGGIDVLVTHTPPKSHRDLFGRHGCEWLLKEVWRVKPRLHVFGHIHAMPGRQMLCWDRLQEAVEAGHRSSSQGIIAQVFDLWLWIQVLRAVYWGFRESLWDLIWGGAQKRTVVVNAALMNEETKKLLNTPQVVEL